MKTDVQKLNKGALGKGIKLIVLFGSRAEKKVKSDSDYDVAVLMDEKNDISDFKNYGATLFFLSEALGIPGEKIDLTRINEANPLLQHEIFSTGKLIFGDRILFDEYRGAAFREYIDAKKLLETEYQMIKKRLYFLKQLA